jgi:hypoxanthine-DNA glycosylase
MAGENARMKASKGDDSGAPIQGFAPISRPDARVLVLGSMPGVASLCAQQYYSHPRNSFWPIMGGFFGFDAAAPYDQRVAALLAHRVAVWDVLAACERDGSLDAAIETHSMVVNDFAGFFRAHPHVVRVCFNGATAHAVYRKRVLPELDSHRTLELVRLPSTSPAHAGMALADKLVAWRIVAADKHAALADAV